MLPDYVVRANGEFACRFRKSQRNSAVPAHATHSTTARKSRAASFRTLVGMLSLSASITWHTRPISVSQSNVDTGSSRDYAVFEYQNGNICATRLYSPDSVRT